MQQQPLKSNGIFQGVILDGIHTRSRKDERSNRVGTVDLRMREGLTTKKKAKLDRMESFIINELKSQMIPKVGKCFVNTICLVG